LGYPALLARGSRGRREGMKMADEPKFKIGDSLYCVNRAQRGEHITCPECGGTRTLKVSLFDGTEYIIDCQGCAVGYDPPQGVILVYRIAAKIEKVTISGVKTEAGQTTEYRISLGPCVYRTFKENELFKTPEEAQPRANELICEQQEQEQGRINAKVKDHRSWAWHVHYYRQKIRDAEKAIAYATDQLDAAKRHVKVAGGEE
jgi:hypothetical protein